MRIYFNNWKICTPDVAIGCQFDNLSRTITVVGELPDGYDWEILLQHGGRNGFNFIQMRRITGGAEADLTFDDLSKSGRYDLQLRGISGNCVRHTNLLSVLVDKSLSGNECCWQNPTWFTQIEMSIRDVATHPPMPGDDGYWLVWDSEAQKYIHSQFALPDGKGLTSDDAVNALVESGIIVPLTDGDGALITSGCKILIIGGKCNGI